MDLETTIRLRWVLRDICPWACGLAGMISSKGSRTWTYLESLVADGEDDEGRLTVAGLTYFSRSPSENPKT